MRAYRSLLLGTAISVAIGTTAFGATIPVGTSTGTAVYNPINLNPADGCPCGAEVRVGAVPGATGTWTMSAGELFSISAPSGVAGADAAPYLGVGRGDSSSQGTVTLTGSGTQFSLLGDNNGATVQIGRQNGTGTLNVHDGATFAISDPNSATTDNDDAIHLGESGGTGTLDVNSGTASIQTGSGASLYVGANNNDDPLLAGTGIANFTNNSTLILRDLANNIPIDQENGASLDLGQGDNTSGTVTVDHSSVTVDGQDSNAEIVVAEHAGSTGNMTVTNNSAVAISANSAGTVKGENTEADLVVGSRGGSNGTLDVNGASTVTVSGPYVFVGIGDHDNSTGAMTISGGSTLSTVGGSESDLEIGKGSGSVATLDVSGGSTISMNAPYVYVGIGDQRAGASGTMTMSGGSTFSDGGVASDVQIGQWNPSTANGGVGKLSVSGNGTKFDVAGSIWVGQGTGAGSSQGTLKVETGGEVTASSVNLYKGGTLMGNGGTINADVNLNAGGVIAPGASPGTMTINGDLNSSSGLLAIQIAGTDPSLYDHLILNGDLNATTPLNIQVSFLNSFLPQIGDTFDFLQVLGLINAPGDPFNVSIAGYKSSDFDIISNGGTFSFKTVALAATPLPTSLPLFGTAFLALGFLAKRRGRSLTPAA